MNGSNSIDRDFSGRQWLVLYTKSRNEKLVTSRLVELGIEAYCPLKRTKRRWSDRLKWVEEPLFSSYVFVRVTQEERDAVFGVPGIVRYLFWLGKPAVARDEEIERIKSWLNDFDHDSISIDALQVGEKVNIASGPLTDRSGEVVSQQGNQLFMRLEGMGIVLKVDLRENKVEKTSV